MPIIIIIINAYFLAIVILQLIVLIQDIKDLVGIFVNETKAVDELDKLLVSASLNSPSSALYLTFSV